jgi:hypothetical protein
MAINKNHEFEDLDGIKCSIVEKNASKERVEFLKPLLEGNGFKVIIVPSPVKAPVAAPKPGGADATAPDPQPSPALPETFTVGVTDVMFNPTNAIFGRLLRTKDGHVVTLAYWQQKEKIADDEMPYFENKATQ